MHVSDLFKVLNFQQIPWHRGSVTLSTTRTRSTRRTPCPRPRPRRRRRRRHRHRHASCTSVVYSVSVRVRRIIITSKGIVEGGVLKRHPTGGELGYSCRQPLTVARPIFPSLQCFSFCSRSCSANSQAVDQSALNECQTLTP